MEEYLIYNEVYRVIICRSHKYAISPNSVSRHLQKYHQSIPLKTRQFLEQSAEKLDLVTTEEVGIPWDETVVDGLEVHDGFKCEYDDCNELRGSIDSMKKHCQQEHNWKVKSNGVKWTCQKIQTFFQGHHLKYVLLVTDD